MKRWLKRSIVVLVVVALVVLIAYRFLYKKELVPEETRPTVSLITPELRDIINTTDVIGVVEPSQEVSVLPKMAGDVLTVNFEIGQHVNEGDVLITINSDALTSLKIQVDAAKISRDDTQTAVARTQALFATGAVSQQALESAQSAASAAKLQYDSALNQYNLQSGYTSVKAPIGGIIESKNVDLHDTVAPSKSICSISGQSGMSISFGVTETAMQNLNIGDMVDIEKDDSIYKGKVSEISTKVDMTGLFPIKASIDDAQNLTSGSNEKLSIISSRADQVMSIPISAVSYASEKAFVYTYVDGVATKTDISVGLYDDKYIAVTEGLDQSSQVITTWSNELYNGAEVLLAQ